MAWKFKLVHTAERELDALDPPAAKRILNFLQKRIATLGNPRRLGAPLSNNTGRYWKYRIITRIQDAELLVLVVRIGHRREVYC